MKSACHVVCSKNRNPTSPSSTYFTVPVSPAITKAKQVSLKWLSVSNTLYNIRAGVNNTLTFTDAGGGHTVTLPPSSYTIASLTTKLQVLMAAVGVQAYTVIYDAGTLKVAISAPAAFLIQFSTFGSCAGVLGFTFSNTTSATSFVGSKAAILYIDCIYISIAQFPARIYTFNGTAYTFLIPVTDNTGNVIQFTEAMQFKQVTDVNRTTISDLDVSLHYENGESIDLNGGEWTFLLGEEY
jgi:hypothetical protein